MSSDALPAVPLHRLVRKIDLRTRAGRRAEILDYVRTHGGFSIFWITENHLRAVEGTAMVDRKEIKVRNRQFPWSDVIILPNIGICGSDTAE